MIDAFAVRILGRDAVFIHLSGNGIRHQGLINASVMNAFHRNGLPVTAFPDQIDCFCIGCKRAEYHAVFCEMRPEIGMGIKGIAQKKLMNVHENVTPPAKCLFAVKIRLLAINFTYCVSICPETGACSCSFVLNFFKK